MKTVYFILLSFICLTLCHSTNSYNYRYDDLYRLIRAEGEQVHTDTLTNGYRCFQWNEDNQLLGVEENGYISRYTYDSQGERIVKAHGGIQGVFINGAPAASIIKAEQITTYISPFMTVTGGRFTKHYYAGTKRIASKIGNGTFNNQYRPGSHNILAGGVNCIERYNQIEQNRKEYIRSLGVPPGPPTMKGIYAEPEYSGQAFPDGGTPQNTAPANWPHKPIQAPPGGPPGPPVQYGPDITNETANGGFGFITTGHIEETDRYFYHSDHLGSSSYITDWKGNVSQFMVYLPFGELLVDKHVTGKSEMPYKFNAKEKDEETGLYYYGARYYNGKDQVWMGVDPAWEKYPGVSPYVYCANNPVKYADPTGEVPVETVWDVINIGMGVDSFTDNVRQGNSGAAVVDALGILLDVTATIIPYVPGGAATGIKALRTADKAVDAMKVADKANDARKTVDKAADAGKVGKSVETSRAARREAMREADIPTSQQPKSQSKNASGREYSYDVPKEGGGTQTKSVQQQTKDRSHQNQPHWEAGKVKERNGQVQQNNYGRPKLENDKSKVNYNE